MPRDMIVYKGQNIAKGSHAAALFEAKKWADLDKHLAALDKQYRRYAG